LLAVDLQTWAEIKENGNKGWKKALRETSRTWLLTM
jgi:hypothetical protein